MGACCASAPMVKMPENIMHDALAIEKTDNWNRLMGRTWYMIASGIDAQNDVFFECYDWEVPGKKAYNHTLTKSSAGKVDDYPKWNVTIKDGKFVQQPTMTGFRIGIPLWIDSKILSFPENDSHDQFWSLIQKLPDGKWMLCMFALTPHVT